MFPEEYRGKKWKDMRGALHVNRRNLRTDASAVIFVARNSIRSRVEAEKGK
jgi:hypothetical protein